MTKYFNKFKKCINEQRYFDAHEALEEVWFPRRFEEDDEMKLLKGFINAAVSFELNKRGRVDASNRVWKNYLKYRPLLSVIDSPYIKEYNELATYIEKIKITIHQ